MKKPDFENLMRRLGSIPGLGFLSSWVTQYRGTTTGFSQKIGDLQAYRDIARDGVAEVRGAVSRDDDDEADLDGDPDGDGSGDEAYREDDYGSDVYGDDDWEY